MKTRRPRLSVGAAICRDQSSFSRRGDDPPRGTPSGLIALLVLMAFATGAWSQAAVTPPFHPTFAEAPCPSGVVTAEGNAITCGYLTVLENRADRSGRTIRLFALVPNRSKASRRRTRCCRSARCLPVATLAGLPEARKSGPSPGASTL